MRIVFEGVGDGVGVGDGESMSKEHDQNRGEPMDLNGMLEEEWKLAMMATGLYSTTAQSSGVTDMASAHQEDQDNPRVRIRKLLLLFEPWGAHFLARAKQAWLAHHPEVIPNFTTHKCAYTQSTNQASGCSYSRVTMRLFVPDPPTLENMRRAHLCLYDHVDRKHICLLVPSGNSGGADVHRPEWAAIDHDFLYFCTITGRVHVCGPGTCRLGRYNVHQQGEYQQVCPVTGYIFDSSGGASIGSEFWRAGDVTGSSSDLATAGSNDAHYSGAADDLTFYITRLAQKKAAREKARLDALTAPPPLSPDDPLRRVRYNKGAELARYIEAKSRSSEFVSRRGLTCPQWQEWDQKFCAWPVWLDGLVKMHSFAELSAHLNELANDQYRQVVGMKDLMRRYATAVVYASLCAERYVRENELLQQEALQSIKRSCESASFSRPAADGVAGIRSINDNNGKIHTIPPQSPLAGQGSDRFEPIIVSQIMDRTMGSLTRSKRGATFVLSTRQTLEATSILAAGDSNTLAAVPIDGSTADPDQEPLRRSAGLAEVEARLKSAHRDLLVHEAHSTIKELADRYAQRVLCLWDVISRMARSVSTESSRLQTERCTEFFPIQHFVFAALDVLAEGTNLNLTPRLGKGPPRPYCIISSDPELAGSVPKDWTCIDEEIYKAREVKKVQANITNVVSQGVRSGVFDRDIFLRTKHRWDDLSFDNEAWSKETGVKQLLRAPPKIYTEARHEEPRPLGGMALLLGANETKLLIT